MIFFISCGNPLCLTLLTASSHMSLDVSFHTCAAGCEARLKRPIQDLRRYAVLLHQRLAGEVELQRVVR